MTATVRQVLRALHKAGWEQEANKATNHRKFKKPTSKGMVIVSGNPGDTIPKGTLNAILKQAGLKPEDL
jgi:predicted RNA binding protein YcfA (HicA-like mRNA interferase family)